MRVVGFDHEIRDGELKLIDPQPPGVAFRRKPVTSAEEGEDVRGLADQQIARLQERRRKRRMSGRLSPHQLFQFRHAALAARDIDIVRARFFQREPHEFAATLNLRPVIELVAHHVLLIVSQSRVCEMRSYPASCWRRQRLC
jgi:hypothetical protein